MLSAFIVSERPFAFHCGPDLSVGGGGGGEGGGGKQ